MEWGGEECAQEEEDSKRSMQPSVGQLRSDSSEVNKSTLVKWKQLESTFQISASQLWLSALVTWIFEEGNQYRLKKLSRKPDWPVVKIPPVASSWQKVAVCKATG